MSVAARRRCFSYVCAPLLIGAALGLALAPQSAGARRGEGAGRPARARASVVGGAGAAIASFPFQVALYDPAAGSPAAGFFCGGVIVDSLHVITAAHCLASGGHGRGASVSGEVAVLAGSTHMRAPDPGSVRDPAASLAVDPYYDSYTNDYDVGVVTLARPLWSGADPPLNGVSRIAPLALAPALAGAYDQPGETAVRYATVSGWGDMRPAPAQAPSYPDALRASAVPLVEEPFCREEYAAIEQPITPRMLCAGASRPRADSCYGDSGGPLVVDRDSPARPPSDYVLVGLVDFGNGCAQPGFAGVYTRIADPAIAHFLASGVGRRAKASGRRHVRGRHGRGRPHSRGRTHRRGAHR